jgi:hypothetical protein
MPGESINNRIMKRTYFWTIFAAITFAAIAGATVWWSLQHPYGTSWDESQYLNEAQIDAQRLQHGMLLRLGGRILIMSLGRPPAYRIFALPILGPIGFHTAAVRLVSLACFALSSFLVYLTARRLGSSVGGGFATLVFCLSPIVIAACRWFSTEGPLYLATAATLYLIFEIWSNRPTHKKTWVGLGTAIGVGLLAKASFLAILLPVLVLWLIAERQKDLGIPKLVSQWKAGLLVCLIAGPWWIVNIRPAMSYAKFARGFIANSLGTPSLVTWMWWLGTVIQSLIGYGLSIVIALVVIAAFVQIAAKKKLVLDSRQKLALWACACAAFPIMLVQLTGTNHLLRHISPAMIPLAIGVGALAEWCGWAQAGVPMAVSAILFCGQLAMIVAPVFFPNKHPVNMGLANGQYPWRVMALVDQWDWTPVLGISHDCGVTSPKISYLGAGAAFDKEQILRPWAAEDASTGLATLPHPDVMWLWHYEEGPIDWQTVMASADASDLVITAPDYVAGDGGGRDINNQHNSELAERLSNDPNFRQPIRLELGRFTPVAVLVFANKNLSCRFPES